MTCAALIIVPSAEDSELRVFYSLSDLHERSYWLCSGGYPPDEVNSICQFASWVYAQRPINAYINRMFVKRVCFNAEKGASADLAFLDELVDGSEYLCVFTMNQTGRIQRALDQHLVRDSKPFTGNYMLHFDIVEPVPGESPYVATAIR
jgi:hypothetical protein